MTKVIYVLTGANGFLGNTIARKLAEKEEVRCLVLPGTSREALKGVSCRIVEGDVTKPESLDALFEDGEDASFIMLHCASIVYTRSKYHPEVEHVNIEGVRHVVAKALQYHAKLIYVSSVHAIPEKPKPQMIQETKEFDPDLVQGLYAKTKAAGSKIVMDAIRKEGLEGIIVHPSGIIGPGDYGDSHMTRLFREALAGRMPVCIKGGYDFVDVRDVADGVIAACTKGRIGETYLLTNRYIEISEILNTIAEKTGRRKVFLIPYALARLGVPLLELYYNLRKQTPLFTRYSLMTVRTNANFDHRKADTELGYHPRPLEETIHDTILWLQHHQE